LGAKSTPGSVSKSTGLVVSGEAGGKKLLQALKLGVRVINAEEFLSMVEEYRQSK
jgi:NAD-dependent DNA ligase